MAHEEGTTVSVRKAFYHLSSVDVRFNTFAMGHPRFQIMSDLHLETPLNQQSYRKFEVNIDPTVEYLCLLGDIGLVQDNDLLWCLENLLQTHSNLTVFYVLGNHEPYQISLDVAHKTMRSFEQRMSQIYGPRFFLLTRTRHDINSRFTVLGCTLWSHIKDEQARDVWRTLTDFNNDRGIRDWDVVTHREEHQRDIDWLNEEVSKIESEDPERQIIILTHHSPTLDERINDPRHRGSKVQSGFVTDLSQEACWKSQIVKCWAFGHTHYSGYYHEDGTGKLVYSNQRGYSSFGAAKQPVAKGQIVSLGGNGRWQVEEGAMDSGMKAPMPKRPRAQPAVQETTKPDEGGKTRDILFGRVRRLFK